MTSAGTGGPPLVFVHGFACDGTGPLNTRGIMDIAAYVCLMVLLTALPIFLMVR